jgi:hypothetical protein
MFLSEMSRVSMATLTAYQPDICVFESTYDLYLRKYSLVLLVYDYTQLSSLPRFCK